MFKLGNPKIAAYVFLAFLASGIVLRLFQSTGEAGKILITYSNGSFSPSEVTVEAGTTVEFESADEEFWPASDPHPTHTNLNGFDPGAPIPKGKVWSFRFNTPGVWKYHNHINTSATGTVLVTNGKDVPSKYSLSSECKSLAADDQSNCWYDQIKLTAEKKGVDAAFQLFTDVYSEGASLGCHWTAHLIGYEAYKQYVKGNKFKITKATSYCGYAFYHGFMEPLLRETKDPQFAVDFCEEVNKALGKYAKQNCYHGIGHGFTEDPPPKNTWGNPDLMAKPGLKICEKLFGDNIGYLSSCTSGVFTVIAHFAEESKYGLDLKDPLSICAAQIDRYKVGCYGEFAPKLAHITNQSPEKALPLLLRVKAGPPQEIAIMDALNAMLQDDVKTDLKKYINGCRIFESLENFCLRGAIGGIVDSATPEHQHERVIYFCNLGGFSSKEKDMCFQAGANKLSEIYSPARLLEVSNLVPPAYKDYFVNASRA